MNTYTLAETKQNFRNEKKENWYIFYKQQDKYINILYQKIQEWKYVYIYIYIYIYIYSYYLCIDGCNSS